MVFRMNDVYLKKVILFLLIVVTLHEWFLW